MQQNGRVDIYQPDTNRLFSMYDKIACDSKATEYRDPLTGNWTENNLSRQFFSKENIEQLQNGLVNGVYRYSNGQYRIGFQCTDTLKIIMRSTYLTYAKNLSNNIQQQLQKLNKIVLDYCIPQVLGEAKGYLNYLNDVSTLPTPIDRPVLPYGGDDKNLILPVGF